MDVKWIKLSTDIFENRKIRQIESLPEGDCIIVIWLKLLCLAGTVNDSGMVYFTRELPYTDQMLATEFNRPLPTVQLALSTFQKFGMIEIIDNVLCLSNWEKYQNADKLSELREYNRLAQQRSRARRRSLETSENGVNDKSMTSQPCQGTEEEGEQEEEKEHSLFLSGENESEKKELLGGNLGRGLVLISQEEIDALLNVLSVDEFDHYVSVVASCEERGKHFGKTHYQAILDMAEKDRRKGT